MRKNEGSTGCVADDVALHATPKRRLRIASILAAISFGLIAPAVTAPAAEAATANGGVYIITPSWWGHCVNFGGVAGLATVNSYVGHSNAGNYGDDIAWVPVRLGTTQSIQIRVACRRFGFASGASMSISVRPSRNGQSFFVGPDSSYWAN